MGGTIQSSWAVILCKCKGAGPEPFPLQYYKDLFTADDMGSPWNMVRYFSDYSHGRLDLTGSKVFGGISWTRPGITTTTSAKGHAVSSSCGHGTQPCTPSPRSI